MFQKLDNLVFEFVHRHLQQSWLQYVSRDITSLGGDTLVALITVFVAGFLWSISRRRAAAKFAVVMLATAAIIVGLKLLVGRPCPLQPDPYQHHLDFPTGMLSLHLPCMPSGHTMGSTVLYGTIAGFATRKWIRSWLIVLPICVGVTRVVLSAHWMSDVVVGYGLGWIVVGVSRWFDGRLTSG